MSARETVSGGIRQTLAYGSESIDFSLSFSTRLRLSITVEPDGVVVVKAPATASLESVFEHLRRRAGWIIRQCDHFAAFGPRMPPKQYVSGETHRYLGRQYRLRICSGTPPSVKLIGRYFDVVTAVREDTGTIRQLLNEWFRQRAMIVFGQRMESCLRSTYFRNLPASKWSIRQMERRWGSCTKRGAILLNLKLIHVPPACIDYVITHELCHLIHHRHDAKFYRLLDQVMFDWRKWKERLEQFSH